MEAFDLRAFREKLGISQAELARRIHYSQNHISQIEHGKRPATRRFMQILGHVFKGKFETRVEKK